MTTPPYARWRELLGHHMTGKRGRTGIADAATAALVDLVDELTDNHMLSPEASLDALRRHQASCAEQDFAADLASLVRDCRARRDGADVPGTGLEA